MRLLRGRATGLQHVQTDEQQNQTAGDFECRQRDAEHAEDELAGDGEAGEHDEAGDCALARHALAAHGIGALSNGQKRRNGGKGVDEKKDGAKRQQGKAHDGRLAELVESIRGWVGEEHLLRLEQLRSTRQGKRRFGAALTPHEQAPGRTK